jgi:hypothetical protein
LRAHLEESARRGGPSAEDARAQLEVPECPEEMEYLVQCVYEVSGRSGEGFAGFARVSHREIEAYGRLRGVPFEPAEVEIIRALDDALLNPDAEPEKSPDEPPAPHRPEVPVWKTRTAPEPLFVTPIDC